MVGPAGPRIGQSECTVYSNTPSGHRTIPDHTVDSPWSGRTNTRVTRLHAYWSGRTKDYLLGDEGLIFPLILSRLGDAGGRETHDNFLVSALPNLVNTVRQFSGL